MNLSAEQIQIASLIDARVQELSDAGNDDVWKKPPARTVAPQPNSRQR